eukprot:GILI01002834.1.p1 GENE.GILI01002834.1~~GILI01002834.1.p1  ORF type:complete len:359 (-),score=106.19 GILI01002834.1:92-1111(-)
MAASRGILKEVAGRSNSNGMMATLFGGSGFAAPYIVQRLAEAGTQLVTPFRRGDWYNVRHLRVCGDLGQVTPVEFTLLDNSSVRKAVANSDVVINMIAQRLPDSTFSVESVQVKAAREIAQAAKDAGAKRFVHFSCLGASKHSPSAFLRAKALGEEAVRDIFPNAIIIRPADMIGYEDRLLCRMARQATRLPFIPLIDGGLNKIQPVYVDDVAQAVINALKLSDTDGKTYELGGDTVITVRDLASVVLRSIAMRTYTADVPAPIATAFATVAERLPYHFLTRDQVAEASIDKVVSEGALGLQDLRVVPANLEIIAAEVLSRFKKPYSRGISAAAPAASQ